MSVLKVYRDDPPGSILLAFNCPGCKHTHVIPAVVGPQVQDKPIWGWNGDELKPTIVPSIREFKTDGKSTHCHCNVTDGQIVYHPDSPHGLSGRTVPMVEFKSVLDE